MPAVETVIKFLPRAARDLENINAYWQRNLTREEALKVTGKIISDLEELKLFYPAADAIRYEPLQSNDFKLLRSGAYLCICKKVENIIYIYHIAREESEYPGIFPVVK